MQSATASEQNPTVAFLTAGAANMICGSCLRDNALAAALMELGCHILLVPTYTPIRTDEKDVSIDKIFFGGINVYLQQKSALFRHVPRFLDRFLDNPWLVRKLSARGIETDASELGDLTVSMLRGEKGNQRKEVGRLVDWLADDVKPDLINFTNILIAGCAPAIKRRLGAPILVNLQGDDLFLEGLSEPHRRQAFAEIERLIDEVDGFIVFNRYYADFMSAYLKISANRISVVPLGLNLNDYGTPAPLRDRPSAVGYLARICPEKGFHVLVDAFLRLRRRPGFKNVRLRAAGWLGGRDRRFFEREIEKLHNAGADFEYAGELERDEKIEFLRSLDVFSVPTIYREPKGLFVLEALASGVPVVQPNHGAFPELLEATGGGRLVEPGDSGRLAETLEALLADEKLRRELGRRGRDAVFAGFSAEVMARKTLDIYRRFLGRV